ncbi:MAG: hypothetical protein EOP56_16855 [Sphingobacteriales bacterium]|nr:MAG: hypothetical protein EOP56_16855 [Sphingobacteriales bacterium]
MNQDFNRQDSEQTSQQSTPPPRRNYTWIYLAIIALLLGTNIYLFMSRNKEVDKNEQLTVQYTTSDSTRQAVEQDYSAALVRLDELVSKNSQLDSLLSQSNSDVSQLRQEIDAIMRDKNASQADLKRARGLITQLNGKVKTYEERIAELEGENVRLENVNQIVSEERDKTVQQNIGLQQKVRLGAVLHASNIRMTPIDLRRGGRKQKETEKAKRVDVLRIQFDIDENRIAEDGKKDLFLRITGPNGSVLSNAAYGSGVTSTSDGQTLNYTLAKPIDLKQGEPVQNITLDWKQDSDYQKGSYTIEIFNEGYKIGNGTVTLK